MSELMKIGEDRTITARELYEFLQLPTTNYSRWTKKNIVENPFALESVDFVRFVSFDEMPTGGKVERENYRLTIDFAKKLCMTSKSPQGEVARNYFIEVEKRFQEITSKPFALPQNFGDACRMLAETWEHEQLLKAQVKELAPKAELFDIFLDGTGYYKMNTAAKMLGTGSKRLYRKLRDDGVLMDNNKPYQRFVDSGLFVVKAGAADNGFNYSTTLVSPKGLEYISKNVLCCAQS